MCKLAIVNKDWRSSHDDDTRVGIICFEDQENGEYNGRNMIIFICFLSIELLISSPWLEI